MAQFAIGDEVKIRMPRGKNKRGVMGVHMMFITSPEHRFDGATGVVADINPRGTYGIPLYLVDFTRHDNSRVGIPWTAQWFREEWMTATGKTLAAVQPGESSGAESQSTPTSRASTA